MILIPEASRFAVSASAALALLVAAGCSDWEAPEDASTNPNTGGASSSPGAACTREFPAAPAPESHPVGLRVVGNRIEDADGNEVELRGVNRSGTEYKCAEGTGIFDGPSDEASVRAIASWNVNAVRIPLNESCWLQLNGVNERFSGDAYKKAIKAYVELLHEYALVPILELHWAAPGDLRASRLLPMPNTDHSLDFWRDVATTFLADTGVILELFNEPFPDGNRDTDAGWACWRDGCTVPALRSQSMALIWPEYEAAGMQALVDAVRETDSEHVVLLGGLQYSNALSRWLEHKPHDPLENLGAAWHVYNKNSCNNPGCWNAAPKAVSASVPVVATEIGQNDCSGDFINQLMAFIDAEASGYLAWSWNALGPCVPAMTNDAGQQIEDKAWSLVTDYTCPSPNGGYAQAFHDRLMTEP